MSVRVKRSFNINRGTSSHGITSVAHSCPPNQNLVMTLEGDHEGIVLKSLSNIITLELTQGKCLMKKGGAIYILTNKTNKVLYTGVTSDLYARLVKHKEKQFERSFTGRYNCDKLVYYELFHNIDEAIAREKQIKAGSRKKKVKLIESINPEWNDLVEEVEKW